jgi:glycosyltransferase involved in cell wall biosynthesis
MAALRVLHLVPSLAGGAGRAAWRIHHCLNPDHGASELSSAIRCLDSSLHGPAIQVGYPSRWVEVLAKGLERFVSIGSRGFQADPGVFHSFGYPGIGIPKAINQSPVDLVHLHWCGGNLITIEDVARIRKPIVWTLHDQWAFCGAEHLASRSSTGGYRYVEGYTEHNRLLSERGPDLNRLTWARKKKAWRQPFQIVAPSRWLASCAQQSCLMQHWPVAVIPHPIDTDVWRPLNKAFAREALNLPQGMPIILFGVDTGCAKPNKGADLLMRALSLLSEGDQLSTGFELAVFGQMLAQHQLPEGMNYHFLGRFRDDVSLRLAYSAADLLVMPSRVEAFGLTAAEAHACGTPVVAFRTSGLRDVIDHQQTGALAEPFDPFSLAHSIAWVLRDQESLNNLSLAARAKAEFHWSEPIVGPQYYDIYRSVLLRMN